MADAVVEGVTERVGVKDLAPVAVGHVVVVKVVKMERVEVDECVEEIVVVTEYEIVTLEVEHTVEVGVDDTVTVTVPVPVVEPQMEMDTVLVLMGEVVRVKVTEGEIDIELEDEDVYERVVVLQGEANIVLERDTVSETVRETLEEEENVSESVAELVVVIVCDEVTDVVTDGEDVSEKNMLELEVEEVVRVEVEVLQMVVEKVA